MSDIFRNSTLPILLHHKGTLALRPAQHLNPPVDQGSVAATVVVSAVRGLGFAVSVVAGGALTAALIPRERRGEGLAFVGLVGGVPALLSLPLGAWAATHWGYAPVFVATAVAPLVAIVTVPGLPTQRRARGSHGVAVGLRNGALLRPALIFASSASAAGVVVTFLPLGLSPRETWVAPAAARPADRFHHRQVVCRPAR